MALPKINLRVKVPGKGKFRFPAAWKASSAARFVFFIGDEGTVLIYIKGNVVQKRQFVPDSGEQSLTELREYLSEDPAAPLLVVMDTMDQSYIQQTLPPVSSLSVQKLIKRRLDRDFGANDIKGAILLGREKTGRKDWNFIMVSLERSPQINSWLDFITALPNRFQGIYLVAMEAEIIVRTLEHALQPETTGEKSEWAFFVSHNKVGGFRQVILRNGKIVFTRMAQPIGESTPEVIAGNIEQEILSTIEYMRRLSFNPQSGLDIYIIAASGIKSAIDTSKFQARRTHIFTPFEVAQYLGIEGATQPSDQFGDVILASAIGSSRKHILTLTIPQVKQINQLYQLLLYQRVGAAVVGLAMVAYAGDLCYEMYTSYDKSSDIIQRKDMQEKRLTALREEIKNSHIDVEKITDIIDLYQQLQVERLSPVPFLGKVGAIIQPPVKIKSINWAIPMDDKGVALAAGPDGIPHMTAVFALQFPGELKMEELREMSKTLLNNLKTALPGADITYTKLPPGFLETERLEMTLDNNKLASASAIAPALEVELTIKGEVLTASAEPPKP